MSVMQIETDNQQRRYKPGALLQGAALWELPEPPRSAELRLFWRTSGRGDEDVEIVATIPFDNPGAAEQRPFQIQLPLGPYSFSGRLVTLAWAMELVFEPGAESARLEIDLTPWDDDLVLERVVESKIQAYKDKRAAELAK